MVGMMIWEEMFHKPLLALKWDDGLQRRDMKNTTTCRIVDVKEWILLTVSSDTPIPAVVHEAIHD